MDCFVPRSDAKRVHGLPNMMCYIPFHVNGTERAGRAEVFAGTASDAFVFIDGGHLHGAVRSFVVNHLDGSGGAVSGAVAARYAVGQDHAVFLHPNGMAEMDACFFLSRNGLDGTCRANMAAHRAFGTAIAALERHGGLHEVH